MFGLKVTELVKEATRYTFVCLPACLSVLSLHLDSLGGDVCRGTPSEAKKRAKKLATFAFRYVTQPEPVGLSGPRGPQSVLR